MQRFKRKVDHHDHGARLLRAVGDFSSKAVELINFDRVLINNEIIFIPSKGASLDEISLRNKYHGNTG